MVEFINAITGTPMWVAEERADEYKAAGHIPAVDTVKAEKPTEKPKKASTKRGK